MREVFPYKCQHCGLGFEHASDKAFHAMDCARNPRVAGELEEMAAAIVRELAHGEVIHCRWCSHSAGNHGQMTRHLLETHTQELQAEALRRKDSRGTLPRQAH